MAWRLGSGRVLGSLRAYSGRYQRPPGTQVGQTSVFVQTGLKIRELPLVVTKVNNVLQIAGMDKFRRDIAPPTSSFQALAPLSQEAVEIMAGFDRCHEPAGIFRLLETIPLTEVTPFVAVHALKRVVELDNMDWHRNPVPAHRHTLAGTQRRAGAHPFQRVAFIQMLLDIVYRSRDPRVILEGLKIVSRDHLPDEATHYKDRLCEETLVCIAEGVLDLGQICDAIQVLAKFYPEKERCHELVDKFWAPLTDKESHINGENISRVFATLPHLKQSRSLILTMLEAKVGVFWYQYRTRDILEILRVFTKMKLCSVKVMRVISQWLTVNIHQLSEDETLAIIFCFQSLEYIDPAMVKTLEKYIKARGCHIKEKDLVATICEYCLDFKVRSPVILEGVGEYFIDHGHELSTPQVFSMTRIFGELDFHPPNGFKFWQIVEDVLDRKFVEFPPKEIISLLLSFIMIEKYPLNFVRKIFNPYFLDRLHTQQEHDVHQSRHQLKLFDSALKLEVKNYSGPYLPRDTAFTSLGRSSTQRLCNVLLEPLSLIVGDPARIQSGVVLGGLPLNRIYLVDFMIYPSPSASLIRFGATTDNSDVIVCLIRHHEDFDRGGANLIGLKKMQLRHLKLLGFKIMQIDGPSANKLKMYPKELSQYLNREYQKALASTSGS